MIHWYLNTQKLQQILHIFYVYIASIAYSK